MKKIIIAVVILILIAVVGLLIYLKAPSFKKEVTQESLEEVVTKVEQLMQDKNYSEVWNYVHPDDKARWANKDEYVNKVQRINGSTTRKSFKLLSLEAAIYQHPITKKEYNNDVEKSITEITYLDDKGKDVIDKEDLFWQKNANSWVFFSALSSKEDGERLKQSGVSSIDFKELNKEPQKYNNTLVKYTGEIIQIQEDNGVGFLRMNVTKNKYGYWDNTIYVVYGNHTDAVEKDIITVYGKLTGSVNYESIAGWNMTVPSMEAFLIEKVEK